jgi:hypothetical protein
MSGDALTDSRRPRPQKHNHSAAKTRANKPPRERLLSDAEVRFVYEGELKGMWFSMAEAVARSLPVLPHPEFRVIRMEFRDRSDLLARHATIPQ